MKKKLNIMNNISAIMFFISSLSLLGIQFVWNYQKVTVGGYFVAGIFWGALLAGLIIQILLTFKLKKVKKQKIALHKERYFLIFFVISVIFWFLSYFYWSSLLLFSIGLACTLFSIEMYFCFRRRYRI